LAVIHGNKHQQPISDGLEFERLHQLKLSIVNSAQPINLFKWSLDRRSPVEMWSGHYQRLEEKMEKTGKKSEGLERVSENPQSRQTCDSFLLGSPDRLNEGLPCYV
jgi:hypothetical protein